jgi:tRNA A22 N-methylase
MYVVYFLQSDFVVETSLVGCVLNGLSHLHNVRNKAHFAVCLIHGLGGNLNEGKFLPKKEIPCCKAFLNKMLVAQTQSMSVVHGEVDKKTFNLILKDHQIWPPE